VLFAALWLLSEWTRGWAFTGFPWLASGYSQSPPSPLAGFAPVFGVYGVGGLLALAAALTASGAPRAQLAACRARGPGDRRRLSGCARLAWTAPVGEPVKVALLQTNIEQSLKWRPELLQHWLERNLALVRDNPAQLVVLPETTLPLLRRLPAARLSRGHWPHCRAKRRRRDPRHLHAGWRQSHLQRGDQPWPLAVGALRQASPGALR
jgi:apolipoprotein N-acyltransferase